MHTFDIATQPGTRDALNGHWFQNYMQSVSALRGWSDGDTFMAPYVGHPIEGSIFGFIERQNDPRYRTVQWGDGRDYWISLLRSMAFSASWHTQWKIGPASEASIGNVMLHASPVLFVLSTRQRWASWSFWRKTPRIATSSPVLKIALRTALDYSRSQLPQSGKDLRQHDGVPCALGA